jgi:hypothetical protein
MVEIRVASERNREPLFVGGDSNIDGQAASGWVTSNTCHLLRARGGMPSSQDRGLRQKKPCEHEHQH